MFRKVDRVGEFVRNVNLCRESLRVGSNLAIMLDNYHLQLPPDIFYPVELGALQIERTLATLPLKGYEYKSFLSFSQLKKTDYK